MSAFVSKAHNFPSLATFFVKCQIAFTCFEKFRFSATDQRADRFPIHAHFLRLKRSGEFGSFAASGCIFICPADLAQ
jgi:hypothetical protein